MKILLLCDRTSSGYGDIRETMQSILEQNSQEVQTIVLNWQELRPCLGCYGCWLKTPGQCVFTDDAANSIAAKEVNADAVVLLSEITYGGFSADIKAFLDRSVQNILPFFEMHKGEMHHEMRYEYFPIWIAVGYGNVSNAEKRIFSALADRNALNMRPMRYLALIVQDSDELEKRADEVHKALEVCV